MSSSMPIRFTLNMSAGMRENHGWSSRRPPRNDRGYGNQHIKERNRWAPIVAQGRTPCAKCSVLIKPNEEWHLGHNDDRTAYTGPEHKECNLKAASARAIAIRNNKNPDPSPNTNWD